jgi:hypothetical protein
MVIACHTSALDTTGFRIYNMVFSNCDSVINMSWDDFKMVKVINKVITHLNHKQDP